jgi:ABC-type nitrate/sulfonate/bicarbonate transport system substrate-binding protein
MTTTRMSGATRGTEWMSRYATRWAHLKAVTTLMAVMAVTSMSAPARAAGDELVFAAARLPLSLPVYVAEMKGFFADEGVKVRILECAFGRVCLKDLLEGRATLATAADSPIVFASFGSDRFAIVATINTNRNDAKVIARKSGPIKSARDLAGHKVGTFVGTSAHYMLDLLGLMSGIDPGQIDVVPLKPDEVLPRLRSGELDAVALFEPYGFQAVRALGADALPLAGRRVYTQTWNVVIAREAVGIRDEDIQRVLRALDRAEELIRKDPYEAKEVLRGRLGLDEATVAWIWPDLRFQLSLDQSLISTLEGQARWAMRNGHVKGDMPNYMRYLHATPLRRVKPQAVTLIP